MKTLTFFSLFFSLVVGIVLFSSSVFAETTGYQGIIPPPPPQKEETGPVVKEEPIREPISETNPVIDQTVNETTIPDRLPTKETLTPEQIRRIKERLADQQEASIEQTGSITTGETISGGGGISREQIKEIYQEIIVTYSDVIQAEGFTREEFQESFEEYVRENADTFITPGGGIDTGALIKGFVQTTRTRIAEKKRERAGSGVVQKMERVMERTMQYVEENNESVMSFSSKVMTMQNVSKNPFSLLVNIILALLYLLTFLYCTYILNEYWADVWGDRKKTFGLERLQSLYLSWYASRNMWFDRMPSILKMLLGFLQFIISLTVIGVILSFIDPQYTVLSARSIVFAGFIILVVAGSALLKDLSLYLVGRVFFGKKYRFVFFSTGYVLATLSVLVNRIAGLVPSFVFGAFAGVKSYHDKDEEQSSSLLLVAVGFSLAIGLGLWLLTEWAQGALLVLLIGAVYGIMNDLFWALLPLKHFWGRSLYRDYPVIWFVLFSFILFAFFHLLFNPYGDLRQVAQGLNENFWRMIINLVVIVGITFVFRLYARKVHGMMYGGKIKGERKI